MYPLWIQETERPILEVCTWRAVQLEAIAALATDGVLIPGRSSEDKARGAEVKHPAVAILRAATAELRALSQRLGFDLEDPPAPGGADLDVVIALQVHRDLLRPEVVGASQVDDLAEGAKSFMPGAGVHARWRHFELRHQLARRDYVDPGRPCRPALPARHAS